MLRHEHSSEQVQFPLGKPRGPVDGSCGDVGFLLATGAWLGDCMGMTGKIGAN
jgi:hypothetical protein